ncbi:MAG: lactonase family protein [Lactobacillales bacterium]|jgi:6-phosphogluconolactonase|nr:lactonase family protein [Lactobacillales bacterium]
MTKLILGTYTKALSKGIYTIDLDEKAGKLGEVTLLLEECGSTWVDFSSDGSKVVTTTNGGVALHDIATGERTSVVVDGPAPCYVALDEERGLVYSANYHDGNIKIHTVSPFELKQTIQYVGHSVHANQDQARAHFVAPTPDGRLITCDLGSDQVHLYDLDEDNVATEIEVLNTLPGCGPRQITFAPDGSKFYLLGELDATVSVVSYPEMRILSVTPTLPADFDILKNSGAAIKVSDDGRFVYVTNRGHDSLATLKVEENNLELLGHVSVEGEHPRDFNIISDKFIVVANLFTNNLTLFARDKKTGAVKLLQKDVFAPECVCVKEFI